MSKKLLPGALVGPMLCLSSCATVVPSYNVVRDAIDPDGQAVQTVPAEFVTPNVDIPAEWTGGYKLPPISIQPTK